MAISISEFWRLLVESRLFTPEQCQHLNAEFGQAKSAGAASSAASLAAWLVARNLLSGYQSKLLLAGRPGPFFYGEYAIYDRLDQGRFAGRFRAVHAPTGHPVLLQFLTGDAIQNQVAWHTFEPWARQECDVIHPLIQRNFELVDLGAYKFFVREDVPGATVEEAMRAGKLPVAEACRIAREMALALQALHGSGRVHGDVRPRNVVFAPGGQMKLVRDLDSPPGPFPWGQPDPQGDLLDRLDYLAPEMAQAGRAPEPRTDIYALGCTLYALLAGRPPFAGRDAAEKMRLHATARIRPLEEFGAPPHLGQLVAYMMAKNPQVRFAEMAPIAEQLTPFLDPAHLHTRPPAPPPTLAAFESHLQRQRAPAPRLAPATPRVAAVGAMADATGGAAPQVAPVRTPRSPVPPISGLDELGKATASMPLPAPPRVVRRKANLAASSWAMGIGAAVALLALVFLGLNYLGGDGDGGSASSRPTAANARGNGAAPSRAAVAPGSATTSGEEPTISPSPVPGAAAPAGSASAAGYDVVSDDGALLWASPTSGPPVDLTHAPPGAQMYFIVRPAEIRASPYGADAIQALGPRFAALVQAWESAAGVRLDEVAQLVVALHDNNGDYPRTSIVVRLRDPLDESALLSRWGNPAPQNAGNAAVYAVRGWTVYVPADRPGTFLMGAASDVEEVAKNPHARPLLRREMERLLRASDDQRHVSVLFAPNFLFFDAQKLFAGDLKKLHDPLQQFLGDGLNAVLASVQLGDSCYLEMRLYGTLDREKGRLASEMRDRLAQLPDAIEDYVARLSPHPYWRKLALRFPPMVRFVHQHARVGAEDDHAVINAVLPGAAGPNLLAAAELTLVSQPGAEYAASAAPASAAPSNLRELLDRRVTLSFPQLSLDFAMRDVAAEVRDGLPNLPFPFDIKLIGRDLEANGITQNQQIRDFAARDQPLREVLTMLVMKANPITTVKAPNEADQKLIWVVGPDPADPAREIILITTRDAAAQKGYTLPEAFR